MSVLSKKLGETDNYFFLSEKVKDSFNSNYDKQYDVLDKKDLSIRPNQIFLSSLDFNLINLVLQSKIVNTVEKELVTIFGLRTLSMKDRNFKGKYISDYNLFLKTASETNPYQFSIILITSIIDNQSPSFLRMSQIWLAARSTSSFTT